MPESMKRKRHLRWASAPVRDRCRVIPIDTARVKLVAQTEPEPPATAGRKVA